MSTHQVKSADQPIAAISSLTTDIVDAIKGYETMVEKAESDLKPAVQKLLDAHRSHAARLMEICNEMDGNPERAGSMMGAVHTAVANTRDAIGMLDKSALDNIISGEQRILQRYSDAAAETTEHKETHKILTEQRAALKSTIDQLKD